MSNEQRMSKRQMRRAQMRRSQTRSRVITVGVVTILALIVAAILIVPNIRPVGDIIPITPQDNPMVDRNSMGDPQAPVALDVWEDFQCPACKTWSEGVKPVIVENYVATGKVRFTYHFFPFIDNGSTGSESDHSANASLCAADQGRFWDYHDILFANWNGENLGAFSDRRLTAFASTLGLDMPAFGACFDENRYADFIAEDMQAGRDLGVSSTPNIFVNGQLVENALGANYVPSYEDLAAAIDTALAGQ